MPRGKKPLGEVSERHLKRRVLNDALAILEGTSEPKKGFSHIGRKSSEALSFLSDQSSLVNSSDVSISHVPSDFESPHVHKGSQPHHIPNESDPPHVLCESDLPEVPCETSTCASGPSNEVNVSVKDVTDSPNTCVRCLLCKCLSCDTCMHTSESCYHCADCENGEAFLSDEEPLSSDDDNDFLNASNIQGAPIQDGEKAEPMLASWCLKHNITQDATRDLLAFLRKFYDSDLPKDPRTLLKTPANVQCRACAPGLYWHSGLLKGLGKLTFDESVDQINLVVNVDGLPLSKSSHSSFWPILCSVNGSKNVILVGAFHGEDKPLDANDLLQDLLDELVPLMVSGFEQNGRRISVRLDKIVCDVPARSFIFKVKGHMAYFSCFKCIVEGIYVERRVVFLDMNAKLRTDTDFRTQTNEEFHKGETILLQIPEFDVIKQVPLDYMHLILLGVVRKLLKLLVGGKVGVRLQSSLVNEISEQLIVCCSFMPSDFARKPRSLIFLALFKAVEYRMILFYLGPIVLIPLLRDFKDRYKNFLILHVAVTILCSKSLLQHYGTSFPNELLRAFVKGFQILYGKEQISHNVHNLIHIAQDAEIHGVLDNFSAFPFENYLQKVKKTVRKGDKPLQQLSKRFGEAEALATINSRKPSDENIVYSGVQNVRCPLLPGCGAPQYKRVCVNNITVDVSLANRYCCLDDGKIVEIHNIAFNKALQSMVIIGKFFMKKEDFYDYPLPSSHLGIFKVSDLSRLMYWPVTSICRKLLRLPFRGEYVVFPVLHTEKNDIELNAA